MWTRRVLVGVALLGLVATATACNDQPSRPDNAYIESCKTTTNLELRASINVANGQPVTSLVPVERTKCTWTTPTPDADENS